MIIEEGKYYKRVDGKVVGPARFIVPRLSFIGRWEVPNSGGRSSGTYIYHPEGRWLGG